MHVLSLPRRLRFGVGLSLLAWLLTSGPAGAQYYRPASEAMDPVRSLNNRSDLRADTSPATLVQWCRDMRSALGTAIGHIGRTGDLMEQEDPRKSRFLSERDTVVSAGREAVDTVSRWEDKLGRMGRDDKVQDSDITQVKGKVESFWKDRFNPFAGGMAGYLTELEGNVSAAQSTAQSALDRVKDKIGQAADMQTRRLQAQEELKRAEDEFLGASLAFNQLSQEFKQIIGVASEGWRNAHMARAGMDQKRAEWEREKRASPSDRDRTRSAKSYYESAKSDWERADRDAQTRENAKEAKLRELQGRGRSVLELMEAVNRHRERVNSLGPEVQRLVTETHQLSDDYYQKDLVHDQFVRWRDALKKEMGR